MKPYLFADVLRYVPQLTRSQAINLTAKQVVIPDLVTSAGTGHRREFSFYNLIEFAIASELVRVGVEHYGIAQVLRSLRWLIGDPKGFESWGETLIATPKRQRERFDGRLLWHALDPIFQFSYDFGCESAPDLPELDPADKAFVESVRHRIKALYETNTARLSNRAKDRAVRAMLRESPYAQAGIHTWEHFKVQHTRPAYLFLLVWPTFTRNFRRLTAKGLTDVTEMKWVFDFASSPEKLAELMTQSGARIVINLHEIVTGLEADTGELLEEVERERLGAAMTVSQSGERLAQ